jgi:iron complex transport system substrate-binding protein
MPGFVSLSIASAIRAASLNLCTDEYLLLLGKPGEIVSVTRLAQDPLESRLWRQARAYPGNRGSIEQVIGQRPTLLLTMGGGGKATSAIAGRLGIRTIALPYPASIDDVAANLRLVAGVLGEARRAEPWLARLERMRRSKPARSKDSIWISGGGTSLSPGSPAAEWMALAGLAQRRLPNGRADLETLLLRPPAVLVRSDYRSGQMSQGGRWLDHPIVKRLASRTIPTDGRAWTCAGPLMVDEVERLRPARR